MVVVVVVVVVMVVVVVAVAVVGIRRHAERGGEWSALGGFRRQ
jgi:hypothetical protein